MKATFTIAIPARDGLPFVREALASALAQTRPADEVLLVDDASTDGTYEFAEGLARDGRIVLQRNARPTGFADAWNRAAALAASEFVAILHQDDLLHPDFLRRVAAAHERFPGAGHLYAACDIIDEEGRVVRRPPSPTSAEPVLFAGKEYARRYLRGVVANRHIHRCPGVATRRELLTGTCAYRPEAGQLADDDFFLRVGAFTDVAGIAEPLASYREHRGSATARLDSLTLALARDYLFQVRCSTGEAARTGGNASPSSGDGGALGPGEIALLSAQALRFVNRLLVEGIRRRRRDWVDRALKLRRDLDRLCPGYATSHLPVWARPLWLVSAARREPSAATRLYVRAIDGALRVRDLARGRGGR